MLSSILHFSIIRKSSLPDIIMYERQYVPYNILSPRMALKSIILKQKQWHLLDNIQLIIPSLLHIARCTQQHILFINLVCHIQHITDASKHKDYKECNHNKYLVWACVRVVCTLHNNTQDPFYGRVIKVDVCWHQPYPLISMFCL